MTKRLLLNALVTVLGDFVEGLTEENLKVGVWSGKIILKNLKLNENGIKKLKFPIDILSGYVETLEVVIPWASLESQPVKIFLEGVYLLISPLDFSSLSLKEINEQIQQIKRMKLDEIEKIIEQSFNVSNDPSPSASGSSSSAPQQSTSYFERLTTKILDNLEIQLRNVHLRVEDSITFAPQTFSCGVTIDSFVVSTTNQEWEETFIARTDVMTQTQIHKLAKLDNLTLYWNINSVKLSTLQIEKWLLEMQALIYKNSPACASSSHTDPAKGTMGYILEPPNTFTLKIQHNESQAPSVSSHSPQFLPKIKAIVESIDLRFRLDKLQYHQIIHSLENIKYKKRILPLMKHKPQVSVKSNPKLWWRYALILITGKDHFWTCKVP
jgi:vacuolar protein sorting-associated protein 13A/C